MQTEKKDETREKEHEKVVLNSGVTTLTKNNKQKVVTKEHLGSAFCVEYR